MQVVLPGDAVMQDVLLDDSNHRIKIGPGVAQLPPGSGSSSISGARAIAATRSGLLGVTSSSSAASQSSSSSSSKLTSADRTEPQLQTQTCWVESQAKRYVPALGEPVVGIIVARHAEGYRVDIGGSQMAALDALAFEDATKRNKPNLKVGAVVYARVSLALPFCEPELECFDPKTGRSQGFGELSGGMLLRNLDLAKCRALLSPSHPLLPSIGARYPFEVAIGMNGRIWVKTNEVEKTIQLMQSIQDA